jgi:thioredoxin reductase
LVSLASNIVNDRFIDDHLGSKKGLIMAVAFDFDSPLPIAVIGAGPVGLAAAAHLLAQGEEPVIFEAGKSAGAHVLAWGHVRLFSPWRYMTDAAARELLTANGAWQEPDCDAYPTGRELVEGYLAPLAALPAIRSRLRLESRVIQVTRDGVDKLKNEGRDAAPFVLTVQHPDGSDEVVYAKAVIDASGTTATPNPLGAAGVPAIGERQLADRIFYGIPDVLGVDRNRYAGRRVLVVGSGHSAFNALLDLVDLADEALDTTITWAIRRSANRLQNLFGGGVNDALPARGELGGRVQRLVETQRLHLVSGFKVGRLTKTEDGILVAGDDAVIGPFDEIIATTGFRPDLSLLAELRLDLDPAVESPKALAPLIDPNVHSCGSVPPHGESELRHPESGAYIVGMKSYGRAPTFLMLTGYEQVRSIAAAFAGDWEAAQDVQLVLPETGVCSSGILAERGVATAEQACCGAAPAAEPVAQGGSCCGPAVPQAIPVAVASTGGCCS